ncbi:ubiquitin carboxyl-terminal hydrolase [Puccinia sorghi]|uniref:Ubiquitin carboxyl-terminal hydrolase n=1 Tax=Puccinia sorghi TaxID=27349 RepID=A0A0L6U8Y9_9BASI|nr:ubiquitin carboxyl-terminal hydrolase [Puccinia sorghi]
MDLTREEFMMNAFSSKEAAETNPAEKTKLSCHHRKKIVPYIRCFWISLSKSSPSTHFSFFSFQHLLFKVSPKPHLVYPICV